MHHTVNSIQPQIEVGVLRTFPFISQLQMMSVIAIVGKNGKPYRQAVIYAKGKFV